MVCCCCWWLVLLGTGNRSARIIKISRFFKFFFILFGWRRLLVSTSAREGRKAGRQEEENKVKSKTAGVLDHDNGIQRKREKRTRDREIMPHWWTPCLEAYPIRSSYPDSSFYETLSSSSSFALLWRNIVVCCFFPCLSSLMRLLSHNLLSLSSLQLKEASTVRSCFYIFIIFNIFKCPGFFEQIV